MTTSNGGPAYPTEENRNASNIGVTVLDYMAGSILQGIVTGMIMRGVPVEDFASAAPLQAYNMGVQALRARKMYE